MKTQIQVSNCSMDVTKSAGGGIYYQTSQFKHPYQQLNEINESRKIPKVQLFIQYPSQQRQQQQQQLFSTKFGQQVEELLHSCEQVLNLSQDFLNPITNTINQIKDSQKEKLNECQQQSNSLLLKNLCSRSLVSKDLLSYQEQLRQGIIGNTPFLFQQITLVLNKFNKAEDCALYINVELSKYLLDGGDIVAAITLILELIYDKASIEHSFSTMYAHLLLIFFVGQKVSPSRVIKKQFEEAFGDTLSNYLKQTLMKFLIQPELDTLIPVSKVFSMQNQNNPDMLKHNMQLHTKGCILLLGSLFNDQFNKECSFIKTTEIIMILHYILSKALNAVGFKFETKPPKDQINKDKKQAKQSFQEQQMAKLQQIFSLQDEQFIYSDQNIYFQYYVQLFVQINRQLSKQEAQQLNQDVKFKFLLRVNEILLRSDRILSGYFKYQLQPYDSVVERQQIRKIHVSDYLNEQLADQYAFGEISLVEIIESNYLYEEQIEWFDKANSDVSSFLTTIYEIFSFILEHGQCLHVFRKQFVKVLSMTGQQCQQKVYDKFRVWIIDIYMESLDLYQIELINILLLLFQNNQSCFQSFLTDACLANNLMIVEHVFRTVINNSFKLDLEEYGPVFNEKQANILKSLIFHYNYQDIDRQQFYIAQLIEEHFSYYGENPLVLLPNSFEENALVVIERMLFGSQFQNLQIDERKKKLRTLQQIIQKSYPHVQPINALSLFFDNLNFDTGLSIFMNAGIQICDFRKSYIFRLKFAVKKYVLTREIQVIRSQKPILTSAFLDFVFAETQSLNDDGEFMMQLIIQVSDLLDLKVLSQQIELKQRFNYSYGTFKLLIKYFMKTQ